MVQLALAGEFVPFAVNLAVAEAHDSLRPFLPLAERLGGLFGSLVGSAVPRRLPPRRSRCASRARSAPTTRASSAWPCSRGCSPVCRATRSRTSTPRSAPRISGLELREVSSTTSEDYVNLVTVSGGGHSISGTLHWRRSEQRIVMVDGHTFYVPPVDHMVMITNDDRPGVIGTVGTLLGDAGINIADMDVGRSDRPGPAVMLIAPTSVVEPSILDALRPPPASSRSSPSTAECGSTEALRATAPKPLWKSDPRGSSRFWPTGESRPSNNQRCHMHKDLVIEVDNEPGALARVAAAVSDAGVNLAAATCLGNGERAQMHILVPHPEATKHALALSNLAVTTSTTSSSSTSQDEPGVLADLACRSPRPASTSISSTWRRTTASCSVPTTPPLWRRRSASPPATEAEGHASAALMPSLAAAVRRAAARAASAKSSPEEA